MKYFVLAALIVAISIGKHFLLSRIAIDAKFSSLQKASGKIEEDYSKIILEVLGKPDVGVGVGVGVDIGDIRGISLYSSGPSGIKCGGQG